ncbi:biotin--[acetyl-CoA-carboxylase] ligase, partial [Seonamhaeicola marinus]
LTFSVFKDISGFYLEHPFYISMVAALALIKTLNFFGIPKISVKWPNDILSENKKICGVLIENVIKNNKMTASIIGMGLNVNQTEFENLPKASSLKIITGRVFSIDEVAITIINNLKFYFEFLKAGNTAIIKNEYVNYLFRKNKPSTFLDAEGCMFSGFIKGVTNTGNLKVLLENNIVKTFDLKEIQLLY